MDFVELDTNEVTAVALCCVVAAADVAAESQSHRKRFGVWYLYLSRKRYGAYSHLVCDFQFDSEMHFYFQMSVERLEKLVQMIGPDLAKSSFNTPLSPGTCLLECQ